jgi:glyoxylase-like metal-dependent hydrolase (beta-lactamase superfamily II)
VCLLVTDLRRGREPWFVLTGDTLFVGAVGRPDLPGEVRKSAADLYTSLHEKVLAACSFGHEEPSENGIVHTTMTLTVSVDAKTLSGTWYNFDEQEDIPFEVTRKTVGNCQAPD